MINNFDSFSCLRLYTSLFVYDLYQHGYLVYFVAKKCYAM